MRRQAAYLTAGARRILPRPGRCGAVHDRFGHALRHGAARDRPRRRRAADRQGLHADGLHRAAAAARAGRPGHRRRAPSPGCSPCWSRATTTTSRSPTRCAASSTAISSWSAQIAERGRYPAINVLKSVSRTMPRSCDPAYWPAVQRARALLATYADMEELIRLGAYRAGCLGRGRRGDPADAGARGFPRTR